MSSDDSKRGTIFDAFGITLEEAVRRHPMDDYEHLVPDEVPWDIFNGDALEILKTLPDNSHDACYCDPPYGISFMGKEWDKGVPSAEVWAEVLRVLKPGAPILAFGGTRMWHRLAVNIEDAGFEIRDTFMWCFGQGFPKGLDLSKGIDKAGGDPSEVDRWEGYKTALKPAWEPIVVAQKPLDGTYVNNALEQGVAGYNIDGSRIGTSKEVPGGMSRNKNGGGVSWSGSVDGSLNNETGEEDRHNPNLGRYPTNFVLSHTEECVCHGTKKVKSQNPSYVPEEDTVKGEGGYSGGWKERPQGVGLGYGDADGNEEVDDWECSDHCPVKILDAQSGTLQSGSLASSKRQNDRVSAFGDGLNGFVSQDFEPSSGGASRFYYCAKASTSEREAGLLPEEGAKRANLHPTAKPVDLNRYFTKLILPPAREDSPRKLLIPFSGVGSEMVGAFKGGWDHVTGIELQEEYVELAHQRLRWWVFGGGADE